MHDWLESIGETERLKIRRISLHFTTDHFTKYAKEGVKNGNLIDEYGGELLGEV